MDAKLNNLVNKSKNNALNIAVLILALFFARNIYMGQIKDINLLKSKIGMESKKNDEFAYIVKLEKKLANLKNTINNKNMSKLINKMGSLAKDNDVIITSIRPQKEKTYVSYAAFPFDLTVTAENYHILSKFVSALENSEDIFMIEALSFKPTYQAANNIAKDKVLVISATLKINTILISD